MPRFLGPRLGAVAGAGGEPIEVDAPVAATPSVLFDAVVLPDGAGAVRALAADGRVLEFLKDQYRHCKPILALGAASALLEKAGIPATLPSGERRSRSARHAGGDPRRRPTRSSPRSPRIATSRARPIRRGSEPSVPESVPQHLLRHLTPASAARGTRPAVV